jgi:hypothetical protein
LSTLAEPPEPPDNEISPFAVDVDNVMSCPGRLRAALIEICDAPNVPPFGIYKSPPVKENAPAVETSPFNVIEPLFPVDPSALSATVDIRVPPVSLTAPIEIFPPVPLVKEVSIDNVNPVPSAERLPTIVTDPEVELPDVFGFVSIVT